MQTFQQENVQNITIMTEEENIEVIEKIDDFVPLIDYDYELDDENNYQSWIQSKNLR